MANVDMFAKPAELILTLLTGHVHAAAVFVDRDRTFGARLREYSLVNLAQKPVASFAYLVNPVHDFLVDGVVCGVSPLVFAGGAVKRFGTLF